MSNLHVKTGDTVMVMSGKSKGLVGKVLVTSPKEGKVIVEKANIVHKHVKPRKQGEQGGIIDAEAAMYACKVQLYCGKCKTGRRAKTVINKDGSKTRVCAKCGKEF